MQRTWSNIPGRGSSHRPWHRCTHRSKSNEKEEEEEEEPQLEPRRVAESPEGGQ